MKSGKCSVWVYGSEERTPGFLTEGIILEVGEGFKTTGEARKWGRSALKRIKNSHYYKIGPAY